MGDIPFDRFVTHAELTAILEGLAARHPGLLELSSIGRSGEGRELWLCTVTNSATGPADEKPAIWVDANIHATELAGSVAALHLLDTLVAGHGHDPRVTTALDTRTFYVVPRLGPDGAELALADRPRWVRSSTRPWPRTDQQDGLVAGDVDGDGRILTMRLPDPHGAWKPCSADERLLVPRQPDERGPGHYYRLVTEGEIQNFDGVRVAPAPALEGLDLNRNYPVDWRTESDQSGAGPYPTSEPEVRAAVQALVDRPNVCAFIQYHTFSGVHLRPYGNRADEAMPTADLRLYRQVGRKATELTGYPAVSTFHEFRYDPKDEITGVGDDWAYEHLGLIAWTTELWSPWVAAGIGRVDYIDWWHDHPVDHDLALLAWSDRELGGRGYVSWYPFDHPQLGPVELGGWDTAYCIRNPPPERLAAEVAPHTDFAVWHALVAPELTLHSVEAEPVGADTWRVRLVVRNTGWLATNVTAKAVERRAVRPVEAEIRLGEGATGATVVGNALRLELGQLAGRVGKNSMLTGFGRASDATDDRAVADWVVRGPVGTVVELEARHPRAGVVRATLTLGAPTTGGPAPPRAEMP